MPSEQYNLEGAIAECAHLMKKISSARNKLETTSERLDAMQQQHAILESSKRNLAMLFDQHKSLAHENKLLDAAHDKEANRVAQLEEKVSWLNQQTNMTEHYLTLLDLQIEEALKVEEAEQREVSGKSQPIQAATATDDGVAVEEEAWSREEEVEYLRLEALQHELLEATEQRSAECETLKRNLRQMLDTLDEGERAVEEKRTRCAALEAEADAWQVKLETHLMSENT